MSRRVLVILSCLLLSGAAAAPRAAAQSRSAQLLVAARSHIAAHAWDSADVEVGHALETAPYIMDSCWAYVWRGVLEYQRGHDRLARLSFRRAFALYPDPGLRGLDTISSGLAKVFDEEFRGNRVFQKWDLDQPARQLITSSLAYPPGLRSHGVRGWAVVRMLVDTLGRVDEKNIDVLEIPDSALTRPIKHMMSNVAFTPAHIGGKPVRSLVAYRVKLDPPRGPSDPIQLIDLARSELRIGQPDSALSLLQEALDPINGATPGIQVYAELVRGIAWQAKHDSARAAGAFELGLGRYRALVAQGVDLAPLLRSLADSVRLTARRE